MEDLMVVGPGAVVEKESKRFIITLKDKSIIEVPDYKVNVINIFGNNQITTQAIDLAMKNGIDINFLSVNGSFKGRISSKVSKNISLRLKQYSFFQDEEVKLSLAKVIAKNKIYNQYKLLSYYGNKIEQIIDIANKIDDAESIDEVMGYEGIGSRIYFESLGKIFPKEFGFKGRSRRPPKDEINALLSLTYQMLLSRIIGQLEIQGLDTAIGIMHSIKYGRESLALDIIEEFRQGFCDFFVLKLINRKQIKKDDFEVRDDEGYYLNEESLKLYLRNFNEEYKMIENTIREQVTLLRKVIEVGDTYKPYTFNKRR